MGIISSLLGNKKKTEKDNNSLFSGSKNGINKASSKNLKGLPDANGLYPSELVMLSYVNGCKINEKSFPSYFSNTYDIADPGKMIKSLKSKGLIVEGGPKDALSSFKLQELKELASLLGVTVKGKKEDIVSQLSDADEKQLEKYIKERTWKLTDSGQAALKANPYIQYFLEKHPYNVNAVGVDIWSVNEVFVKNPKRPYRDIIYHQLNSKMNKEATAIQKDPLAHTRQYCECYRLMGLFVEEEGKSFVNAADLYFQYLYKKINIDAGLKLLHSYQLFRNDRKHQAETIKWYCDDIQLCPYEKNELMRLINELGIEGNALKESMITSFIRANDTGIMTEKEAADFVLLELSGETKKSRNFAEKLAKKAVNKI